MKNSINLIFYILIVSCSTSERVYHHGLTKVWQSDDLNWNASSLTLDSGFMYGTTLDKTIFKLDFRTGNLIWKSQSSTSYAGQKPLVADNQLFIGGLDVINSYDFEGNLNWSEKVGGKVGHSLIDYDTLIIASIAGKGLRAFNKSLGEPTWSIEPEYQMQSSSNPTIQDSVIILGNFNYSKEKGLSHTAAINGKNGKTLWIIPDKHHIAGTALIHESKVYLCYDSSYSNGTVSALDIINGSTIWEVASQPMCHYKPIIYKNELLIPSYHRSLDCLSLMSGELKWSLNTDELIPATELIEFKNKIYFGSANRKLVSVDSLGKASIISEFDYGIGNPMIFKNKLYIPDGNGNLFKLVNNTP